MLDIRLLRDEPDRVRQAMVALGATDAPVEEAIALDARRRAILVEVEGLKAEADRAGVPLSVDSEGGMFGFFLLPELPQNYAQVMASDSARFNRFFHGMLERGVYFAPALYEAGFVSAAHTEADIDATLEAARAVLATL
jgi:glutamate-1-semialdehyde 2,1-aminomutase